MNLATPGRFVIPDVVASHFHFKDGDAVADFGAGSGFYLKVLSEAVGEAGKVYACEIQKQLVEKLTEQARLQGLSNIYPLWCDLEEEGGIPLPDGVLDAGILVNTLFQIVDKESSIKEIRRVLRSGGVLQVIDWTESFGGLGPKSDQVVSQATATALLEAGQFVFEREYPAGDHHYGASYRKV